MLFSRLSSLFRGFASRVLAIDNTALPKDQIRVLREILSGHDFELRAQNIFELLIALKRKHLVDSIIVTKRDGSVIASTEHNGFKEAITGTALFNYVSSELSRTENILIKSGGEWFIVFPFNEKIFVVKASSSLSTIELKALAKELEVLLKKNLRQADNKAFLKN